MRHFRFSFRFPIVKLFLVLGSVFVLVVAPASSATVEPKPAAFTVGFAQVDITPPVGGIMTGAHHVVSVGTEDPLKSKAMVVRNGEEIFAIVGVDILKIPREMADAAIAEASRKTGIKRGAIMICPSHNHSSPLISTGGTANKEYLSKLPGHIAESIEQAYKALQPARMYLGRSLVFEGVHNRRVISKADGYAMNTWSNNTKNLKLMPQILGTEGPIDPELWVARFDAADGKVLGVLVNFACHPTLRKRDKVRTWSADFPGVIAEQIAKAYGKETVSVFTQGAAGNISPAGGRKGEWHERASVFAEAAVKAAKKAMAIEGEIAVDSIRRDVTVTRRDPKEQREGAIERLGWGEKHFKEVRVRLGKMPETRSVPVTAARIGPLGIATNAGELFAEWGIDIKKRSPFPYTIVCELTNGAVGYEPTEQAFRNEGYEALAGVNMISYAGIRKLVDEDVELLKQLKKRDK